jgi:hypothetical protein
MAEFLEKAAEGVALGFALVALMLWLNVGQLLLH